MDWTHFGVARAPFRPVIDTGSYFAAATHEAAHAAIAAAFARRDPAVLIEGVAGTGKSLVARRWLEQLPSETPRILLANLPAARPADLLQAILFDLGLPYRGLGEQELRLAVTEQLLGNLEKNTATVLVVDEAQDLGAGAIEELRLLGNIESTAGSALFVVLIAQPRIAQTLKHPECGDFPQRLGAACRIEPLTVEESNAYLSHQLALAGRSLADVIDDDAVSLLTAACRGIPRLLNRSTMLAAELAASAEAETIDAEAALEALARLGLGEEPVEDEAILRHPGKPRKKTLRKKSA